MTELTDFEMEVLALLREIATSLRLIYDAMPNEADHDIK
jgi:hypothetical protein